MRSHSILRRMLALHAVATLVTAALVSAAALMLVDSIGDRLHRQMLDEYADKMSAGISRTPDHGWTLSPATASWLQGEGSSLSFWIDDGGRRIPLAGLRFGSALEVPKDTQRAYFTRLRRSKIYSGVSVPVNGKPASWIVIVQDLDHPDVLFDDLSHRLILGGGGLLAFFTIGLLGAASWIVRRSLAPMDRASREVAAIAPHQLDLRVDTNGMPLEVLPLLDAFNKALDRVEEAYQIERDFAADAAHELRTPLAILRLTAEQHPEEQRLALLRQIDALEGITERLLLVAEVDAMVWTPNATVDLRAVAEERVAAIAPLLLANGKSIELSGARSAMAWVCASFAERALDVLLENTMKHTPPGTHVTITVGGDATVSVSDTGPGLAVYDDALFVRFATARRGIARSGGLGLAIAQQLMSKCGGSMTAIANHPAGAVFRLSFRPAAS